MLNVPFLLVSYCTSALILSPLAIPLANYTIQKPVFFGGAKKDYVAIAAAGKATTAQFCKGPLTIHEFDAGHWLIWETKDELNDKLLVWVDGLE
jgi:soluble epoxide hydrolase/lipid-phosphate phosphatase